MTSKADTAFFRQPEGGTEGADRNLGLAQELELEKQRLTLALRDAFVEIYELQLLADTATLLFSDSKNLSPVCGSKPVVHSKIIAESIYEADRERVWASLNGASLRACFAEGKTEITEEFRRLDSEGGLRWVVARVVPLLDSPPPAALVSSPPPAASVPSPPTAASVSSPPPAASVPLSATVAVAPEEGDALVERALIFIHDITERKEQVRQRRTLEQYGLALRNIYDIFLEISPSANTYTLVQMAEDKYVSPPHHGDLTELLTVNSKGLVHTKDRRLFLSFFNVTAARNAFASGRTLRMGEFRLLQQDGIFHWTSMTMFPLGQGDEDERYLVLGVDIHSRKIAEEIESKHSAWQQQRVMDERYRIVVEQTSTLIFEWKDSTRYIAPELVERFNGNYDSRDIFDVWREDKVVHLDDEKHIIAFQGAYGKEVRRELTVRLLQRSGGYVWCRITVTDLDTSGKRHCIGTLNDVDKATRAILRMKERAERDTLTGVYNMHTFYARVEELLQAEPARQWHVIRMDINGFKVINDLYGTEEGDRLLRHMANALQSHMRGESVCGRISADIFCACVDFDEEGILQLVRELEESMERYPLHSRVLPSFGICRVERDNTPASVLCDWANLALQTVKGNAITSYAFYDETLRQGMLKDKRIESDMALALEEQEFQIYLQPKVHIESGRIVGAEALVRWERPEGVVFPDEFIPLFERNGFILRLDEYMWEGACKILRSWLDAGHDPLPLSVNVSRMHMHDTRVCCTLDTLLQRYSLPTYLLELELTEGVFLAQQGQAMSIINSLRDRGFCFCLDDFGAGYSSLNILKNLPVETMKLDQVFLDEVKSSAKGKAIIRGVIALAQSIDMKVVAEGVESKAQALFLRENGCAVAQGFYYSPPVPLAAFECMMVAPHFSPV